MFLRVLCSSEHAINGQQIQIAPERIWRGVMPELRCLSEHAAYGSASWPLAGMEHGATAWQYDVQPVHNLVKVPYAHGPY